MAFPGEEEYQVIFSVQCNVSQKRRALTTCISKYRHCSDTFQCKNISTVYILCICEGFWWNPRWNH